jgi:hypothetical protein
MFRKPLRRGPLAGPLPEEKPQHQQQQDGDREDGAVPEREFERAGGGTLDDRIELVVEAP